MNKEKALLKNTVIVSFGRIGTQLVSFFLLPLYTALLSTEEYGIVDLLNTLVTLLVPVINLEIEQGIFRFLIESRNDERRKRELISISVLATAAQAAVFAVIFLAVSPLIHSPYKYFLLLNMICSLFSNLFLQIARGLGRNFQYSAGSFLVGASTVVFNVLFIAVFHWGAYGMLAASMLANLICAIYLFAMLHMGKDVRLSLWNQPLFKELLKYSIPLIPNIINWWIINASDRVIVSTFLSLSANGIYSAANKFPSMIVTVYNIFNISWQESAALNIDSEDRDEFFSRIFNIVVSLFGSVCLISAALMPWIFPLLINQKYASGYWQIPILLVGTFFNMLISFIGSVYVAKKLSREIAKTSMGAAVINIAVNLALISFIGLYAASLSTAAAYFAMFVFRYRDVQKYVRMKASAQTVWILGILSVLVFAFYYLNVFWLNLLSLVLCAAAAVFLNWKYIRPLSTMILQKFHK